MDMFLVTFGVIVFLVLIMAIGVIFGRKPIAGSCGGYKELDVECAAGCKHPCDRRKAHMRAQAQARQPASAKEE